MSHLPAARGPLGEALIGALRQPPGARLVYDGAWPSDALGDDDLQHALYLAYELHYRGLPGVDDGWEWDAGLIAFRAGLEGRFLLALAEAIGAPGAPVAAEDMDLALRAVSEDDEAPSVSRHLERHGTAAQLHEFLIHRSAYQLKEADPHSWALPRLHGVPKAALVEIQADEYGGGRPERAHAQLFADTLAAVGLDARYGSYVPVIPGFTLATVNLMSLLGLHRRWRGAIVGHLALFEMTSSIPNRRYANALRRLGYTDAAATRFFDEHVTADAVHEAIAAVDLAGGLARQEPGRSADIVWGARALVELEGRWSRRLLDAWAAGRSSLRTPVAALSSAA